MYIWGKPLIEIKEYLEVKPDTVFRETCLMFTYPGLFSSLGVNKYTLFTFDHRRSIERLRLVPIKAIALLCNSSGSETFQRSLVCSLVHPFLQSEDEVLAPLNKYLTWKNTAMNLCGVFSKGHKWYTFKEDWYHWRVLNQSGTSSLLIAFPLVGIEVLK